MKGTSLLLALIIMSSIFGIVEAQRMNRPMGKQTPMQTPMPMMKRAMSYTFFGLENFFLIGPLFEFLAHALFFIFSRSAVLCMRLARVFVE